jgi:hypothetical protein
MGRRRKMKKRFFYFLFFTIFLEVLRINIASKNHSHSCAEGKTRPKYFKKNKRNTILTIHIIREYLSEFHTHLVIL